MNDRTQKLRIDGDRPGKARRGAGARCLGHVVLAATALLSSASPAQDGFVSREHQIKAAYLYNFGKYVEWPEDAAVWDGNRKLFIVGIVGESRTADSLKGLARNKTVKGMTIVVRQILTELEYQRCHVLFFAAGADSTLREAVQRRARGSPTLSVGDTANLLGRDTMLSFYRDSNKLKFEVNPDAAKRSSLKISSKLLRVGRVVDDR